MNRGIRLLQSRALPLGYVAMLCLFFSCNTALSLIRFGLRTSSTRRLHLISHALSCKKSPAHTFCLSFYHNSSLLRVRLDLRTLSTRHPRLTCVPRPAIKILRVQHCFIQSYFVTALLLRMWLSFFVLLHMARAAGFEPAHDGIRIHCLTTWRRPIDGVGSGDRTHGCMDHNHVS